jgi:acyl carrier protein
LIEEIPEIVSRSAERVLSIDLSQLHDKSRDLIDEWDSLAHMEIILRIEETLGLVLPEDSVPYVETLSELTELVISVLKGKDDAGI